MATIESILSSEAKIEILRTLCLDNNIYSAQDFEKTTTKNKSTIYKALEELRKENALKTVPVRGNTKYYRLNDEDNLIEEIKSMILVHEYRSNLGAVGLPPYPVNVIFNFRKKLIQNLDGLKEIILFGSAVAGDYTLESDLDFYIVCEEAGVEVEDQIHEIAEGYDHEFSLIIKSEEQYNSDFEKPVSKLADSIIKDGFVSVYGGAGNLEQYISRPGFVNHRGKSL